MSRHARRHDLAVGHDDRHEPHRRSRTRARRGGDRHRQPAPERPRRQERRRALHVRRSRRRDERRVDEGVLRADRGRLPPRVRDRGGARRRTRTPTGTRAPRDPRRARASSRPRCARCSSGARRSRSPRSGTRCRAGRGRSSATAINRVAAEEIRIKLSELCYKSISCDITEDKKHIDLSAEPMILVCAAGLHGSNADDVGKEIGDLPRAQVGADRDRRRRRRALPRRARDAERFRSCTPTCRFVLCTMVGHLFGYEAALAIDATARPLREARGLHRGARRLGRAKATTCSRRSPATLQPCADRFFDGLRTSSYDGALDAGTAVRLASLLRYATGVVPLDVYQVEFGKVGTPSTLVEDLTARAHEGDRGADAPDRRDQAPGEDRDRRHLAFRRDAAAGAARAGAARDRRAARQPHVPRACARWSRSIPRSTRSSGWTRYRIDGDPSRSGATIEVVDTGGIARDIPSRTADNPTLRGTKHRAASEREVTVVRGRADGRTLVIVPEIKGNQTTGLTLLHVRFHDRLPAEAARRVLEGYRDRYEAIADQVTEIEPVMRDDVLAHDRPRRAAHRAGRAPRRPLAVLTRRATAMTDASMRAWTRRATRADRRRAARAASRAASRSPGPAKSASACAACGVCRTDLHLAEGDLPPRHPASCPATRSSATSTRSARTRSASRRRPHRHRVVAPHVRASAGGAAAAPRTCVSRRHSRAGTPTAATRSGPSSTRRYAYALPDAYDDEHAAPLLCAGIVGYRALSGPSSRRAVGSGSTASARPRISSRRSRSQQGATVHVLTRSAAAQRLALELGAASAGPAEARPPEPLDAAILFAPAGALVPVALAALDKGGTLAIAGISPERHPAPELRTPSVRGAAGAQRHREHPRRRRGVPAARGPLAADVTTQPYPLDRADARARRPRARSVTGAAVLVP